MIISQLFTVALLARYCKSVTTWRYGGVTVTNSTSSLDYINIEWKSNLQRYSRTQHVEQYFPVSPIPLRSLVQLHKPRGQ